MLDLVTQCETMLNLVTRYETMLYMDHGNVMLDNVRLGSMI